MVFMDELNHYATKKLNKGQFGFLPGSSIDLCKKKVLEKIRQFVEKQGNTLKDRTHLLFIDYKSAYNNINREVLYQKL